MTARWLQSRSARKFFRHRPAVAALVVISLYLAVAVAVLLGGVTLEQTLERVGPGNLPGFQGRQLAEKRVEDCAMVLDRVEKALRRPSNVRAALGEIRYGLLRVADRPPEELRALVDQGWEIYDELVESPDLNADPSLAPQIEQLERLTGQLFAPLSGWQSLVRQFRLLLGTDRQGRSIMLRGVYSIKVAIQIGVITAFISVLIGSLLGASAAFFGGWVDHVVIWLYTTLSSIPYLVLLVVLAYAFSGAVWQVNLLGRPLSVDVGNTLIPVYVALCATFWIGPCRVIRGETLKIKQLEYIQAATATGFGRLYILVRHILPNAAHLMLINFSLLFIGAIKSEVILSFLGLGVKRGPSWGIMISHSAQEVINGFFWQIGAATVFMLVLVLAFNVLTDALQDVFDPKHL